ncbi:ABC transporter permease [Dethiobacter alkaliphilus]|uniref:ABC transporter permease n=1 Tax=Dethiobacter alkaliphilus TaxID=427926 RepID=UPI00222644BE|nr:ABC transporter permease [Dethiobacter alkaliphilus]MCW3491593.1 ABC transporter permease [Dethiobacter alkaliphilus]
MSILKHLTLRMLKLNKRRTLVTIIGIILSAAMITGVSSIASSFQDFFVQRAIETDGSYHASFYDVEVGNVKYIEENPYTKKSMLSRDLGFAEFPEATNEFKPYLFVKEYDSEAFERMPVHLTEGRMPEQAGEMVISEDVYITGGERYAIGETIPLHIGSRIDENTVLAHEWYSETEKLLIETSQTYTISGYISRPGFERGSTPGHTVVAYLDAEKLGADDGVNVSIVAQNPRSIYDRVPEIAQNAQVEQYSYNSRLLREMGITENSYASSFLLSIMLIIILLISVGSITVIYNAFAISVSDRKKQFGMLASVGATPKQIRRSVFFEGLLLGLVGIPIGIISGLAGIGVTLGTVNRLMIETMFDGNSALRLVVSPGVILITIVFVSIIIMVSAYLPAKLASRISPIDAIRQNSDLNIKGKKLKTSRLTRFLFGIEGELALKNLKRNRKRYRATVFSLIISIVLFITISSFMKYSFISESMYYADLPYNVTVSYYSESMREQEAFFAQIAAMEEVERHSLVRWFRTVTDELDRSHFGSYIQELIEQGQFVQIDEEGRYRVDFSIVALGGKEFNSYLNQLELEADNFKDTENLRGVLINKGIIHDGRIDEVEPMDLQVGDNLLLTDVYTFYRQEEGNQEQSSFQVEIGAVTDILPVGVSYQGIYDLNLIVSDGVFEELRAVVSSENRPHSQMYIDASDSAALVAAIRDLHSSEYSHASEHSLAINDISAQVAEMNDTRTVFAIFLYGFLTLITLIGVTNIFNTISTNVALRRREFAMLKSVGLTPKGFNRMINYESIFYGLKALMYGLPISIAISVLIYNSFSTMFGFAFVLPWREIAYCIIGVFVIVFLTMMHASLKLKSENIIDALKVD